MLRLMGGYLLFLLILWVGMYLGVQDVEQNCIYKNEIVTKQGTYLCIKKYELKEEI